MTTPNPKSSFTRLKIIRYSLITLGWISVILGFIGAFLPILPTTPFLLLAALCFSHSSKRFHDWLIHHRFFGRFISDYIERNGITKKRKIIILLSMWCMMSISMLIIAKLWAVILLIILGSIGSIFILSRNTLPN